jgi:hypothetical protein
MKFEREMKNWKVEGVGGLCVQRWRRMKEHVGGRKKKEGENVLVVERLSKNVENCGFFHLNNLEWQNYNSAACLKKNLEGYYKMYL